MIYDLEVVENTICKSLKSFTDIAVIGLSGGADSTLVACLCVKALGKENVYGVSMPYSKQDENGFNDRSTKLAETLVINHLYIPISSIADSINKEISKSFSKTLSDVNKGNSRSRARMCILYGVAHHLSNEIKFNKRSVRVIGTGNLSEDYIGYDTKGGDALADIFPIGELFKSEVYQFLDWYRDMRVITDDLIDRVPSAGLWDGQTDEKEIGYLYNDMELAIRYLIYNDVKSLDHLIYLKGEKKAKEIINFVDKRHYCNNHKHEAPPVISLPRDGNKSGIK
jgi:NAD+ synthase